jgi:hypothetical protein
MPSVRLALNAFYAGGGHFKKAWSIRSIASGKFLAQLLDGFGNLGLAAAAYNAGSRSVRDWMSRRRQLPAETRHYVRIITGIPAEV